MRLSLRLQSLLDRCRPGLPLWDLCCDHGLLGLAAWQSGRFSEVVLNDAVAHVLKALQPQLPEVGVRVLCAPAEEITEPLTGNVVLAGVGGEKIRHILCTLAAAGRLRATRILACPEKDAEWLAAQIIPGYTIFERLMIAHNHGHRAIYVYEPVAR